MRRVERSDLTIDLMLLDVEMPDISGPELAERVRVIRPRMKVLFMSGRNDSEVVSVKIFERLPKPFTADTLLARVQGAFSYTGGAPPSDEGGGTPSPAYASPRLEDCTTRSRRTPANPNLKS